MKLKTESKQRDKDQGKREKQKEKERVMVDAKQSSTRIVMLPWLAHGHISPFLELAKKLTLTHTNFHIYLCSSPVNFDSIKPKLLSDPTFSNSIELVELHLPSTPELPPQNHTTKGLPQHLTPTLMKAMDMASSNFSNILETLKPDLVIHDFFPLWAPDLASSLNIPHIAFITNGATMMCFATHHVKKNINRVDEFPFPEICSDPYIKMFTRMIQNSSDDGGRKPLRIYERSCNIVLIKSFRELEGKYMDFLSDSFGKKLVPVGPLVPEPVHDDEGMDIMNWLDKKGKSSTVFVSFGSECYLSKEDMEEVAQGLELSNVNFIWVIRFSVEEKIKLEDALPKGFSERVRERGMVVENWAPQMKILEHSSIGGFVSHCGWSSLMESMKFGVPIIAVPIQFDQPFNARLAAVSGLGLEVKRDKNWKLERENIAKVIKDVVSEKAGEDIRRRVKEMSQHINTKADEDMELVVKQLLLVCGM